MTRSLRRSRRAPKKNSDYNVGDVVEINRAGIVLRGRLAQLLTEGTSPNPRWLVKFDGQSHKDEEMYERAFGKLLASSGEDEPIARSKSPTLASQEKASKAQSRSNRRGSNGRNSSTSSEDDVKKVSKESGKKEVQFEEEVDAGSESETSSRKSSTADKVSAREARSRRRQAQIDEETPANDASKGTTRRAAPQGNARKRQRVDTDGEVIKVKLLTGTLFLYRGLHRRAEFIRRV